MHLMSLFSSSFIEEEHQIWYFIQTTQIYLILLIFVRSKRISNSKQPYLKYFFLVTMATRLLRSINQTGNKWAHLKDIGDLLKEFENLNFVVIYKIIKGL